MDSWQWVHSISGLCHPLVQPTLTTVQSHVQTNYEAQTSSFTWWWLLTSHKPGSQRRIHRSPIHPSNQPLPAPEGPPAPWRLRRSLATSISPVIFWHVRKNWRLWRPIFCLKSEWETHGVKDNHLYHIHHHCCYHCCCPCHPPRHQQQHPDIVIILNNSFEHAKPISVSLCCWTLLLSIHTHPNSNNRTTFMIFIPSLKLTANAPWKLGLLTQKETGSSPFDHFLRVFGARS